MMISELAKLTRMEFRRQKAANTVNTVLTFSVVGYCAFLVWGAVIGNMFFGLFFGTICVIILMLPVLSCIVEAYKIKKQINNDYGEMVERLEIVKKTL